MRVSPMLFIINTNTLYLIIILKVSMNGGSIKGDLVFKGRQQLCQRKNNCVWWELYVKVTIPFDIGLKLAKNEQRSKPNKVIFKKFTGWRKKCKTRWIKTKILVFIVNQHSYIKTKSVLKCLKLTYSHNYKKKCKQVW